VETVCQLRKRRRFGHVGVDDVDPDASSRSKPRSREVGAPDVAADRSAVFGR
jgi:hypothetical protein